MLVIALVELEDLSLLHVEHVMAMERLEHHQVFLQLKEHVLNAEALEKVLQIHV